MGLEPGTDPATDALGQLPAVLVGAAPAQCRDTRSLAPAPRERCSPPAISKGGDRLERCKRWPGTEGLPLARWGRECHFSAPIYCHISSRFSSNLQHKLKTKKIQLIQ